VDSIAYCLCYGLKLMPSWLNKHSLNMKIHNPKGNDSSNIHGTSLEAVCVCQLKLQEDHQPAWGPCARTQGYPAGLNDARHPPPATPQAKPRAKIRFSSLNETWPRPHGGLATCLQKGDTRYLSMVKKCLAEGLCVSWKVGSVNGGNRLFVYNNDNNGTQEKPLNSYP
jgi:hypothetical protein